MYVFRFAQSLILVALGVELLFVFVSFRCYVAVPPMDMVFFVVFHCEPFPILVFALSDHLNIFSLSSFYILVVLLFIQVLLLQLLINKSYVQYIFILTSYRYIFRFICQYKLVETISLILWKFSFGLSCFIFFDTLALLESKLLLLNNIFPVFNLLVTKNVSDKLRKLFEFQIYRHWKNYHWRTRHGTDWPLWLEEWLHLKTNLITYVHVLQLFNAYLIVNIICLSRDILLIDYVKRMILYNKHKRVLLKIIQVAFIAQQGAHAESPLKESRRKNILFFINGIIYPFTDGQQLIFLLIMF